MTSLLKLERLVDFVLKSIDSLPVLSKAFSQRFSQKQLSQKELASTNPLELLVKSFEVFMDLILRAKSTPSESHFNEGIKPKTASVPEFQRELFGNNALIPPKSNSAGFKWQETNGETAYSSQFPQKFGEIAHKLSSNRLHSRSGSRSDWPLAMNSSGQMTSSQFHFTGPSQFYSGNNLDAAPIHKMSPRKRSRSPQREKQPRIRSRSPIGRNPVSSMDILEKAEPIGRERQHKREPSEDFKKRMTWNNRTQNQQLGSFEHMRMSPSNPQLLNRSAVIENSNETKGKLDGIRSRITSRLMEDQKRQMRISGVQGKYSDLSQNLEKIQKEINESSKQLRVSAVASKLLRDSDSSEANKMVPHHSQNPESFSPHQVPSSKSQRENEKSHLDSPNKPSLSENTNGRSLRVARMLSATNKSPEFKSVSIFNSASPIEEPIPTNGSLGQYEVVSKREDSSPETRKSRSQWDKNGPKNFPESFTKEARNQEALMMSPSKVINEESQVESESKKTVSQPKTTERKPRRKTPVKFNRFGRSASGLKNQSMSKSVEKSREMYTSSIWKDSVTKNKTDQKLMEMREMHNAKSDMRAHYLDPLMDIDIVSKKKKNHHAKHLQNSLQI